MTADKTVVNLDREVVIAILEAKCAAFGFPIVPEGSEAEKLCGWLAQEPPNDYLYWQRDPRLVGARIGPWGAVFHPKTRVGVLVFSLQGRWSEAGFLAMSEALRIYLPSRHHVKVVQNGCVRISIFLSIDDDLSAAEPAIRRAYATIARMCAAGRELPVSPPKTSASLPHLLGEVSLFKQVCDELEMLEYPKVIDAAHDSYREAQWQKLRQVDRSWNFVEPTRFRFDWVLTAQDIVEFVARLEG